jgi:D-3-phosphoglycerate dehydrogenase
LTRILFNQEIHPDGRKILEGKFDIFLPEDDTQEGLIKAVREAEGMVLKTVTAATREVIKAAPKLKIISRTGVGVDNVDVEAATEQGILVCNTPAANNLSVAEHTLAMILSLAKDLPAMGRAVRNGGWKQRTANKAVELSGRTLGIVGMGNIGSLVAKKCEYGLDMRILAYDPYAADNFPREDYEFTPGLTELFSRSDFVTLHCPNIPETRGMINRELLGVMGKDAWLINCARGGVVDEEALIAALREKRIGGAALDVFALEPPAPDNPLLAMENVILTPHSAALTREAAVRMSVDAAAAIVDFFSGKQPRYIYNKKALGL